MMIGILLGALKNVWFFTGLEFVFVFPPSYAESLVQIIDYTIVRMRLPNNPSRIITSLGYLFYEPTNLNTAIIPNGSSNK